MAKKPVSKNPPAVKPDTYESNVMAEMFGFAQQVIEAVPELKSLFERAANEGWYESSVGLQRFQAEVKNTDWYRNNNKYFRDAFTQEKIGGANWEAQLQNAQLAVETAAVGMGASLTDEQKKTLARRYLYEGWGDTKENRKPLFSRALSEYVTGQAGEAGTDVTKLKNIAYMNGINYSDGWYESSVKSIASGLSTFDDKANEIRRASASRWPVFAKQIESGYNAMDLASPYIEILSNELELDRGAVTLNDPYISNALGGFSQDGNPQPMNLYDFTKKVRQDPRWLKTIKAQNEVSNIATSVLQMFGLRG
jgi:hypothetical protein